MDPLLDTGEPRHANAYHSPVSYSDPTGLLSNHAQFDGGGKVTRTYTPAPTAAPPAAGNKPAATNVGGSTVTPPTSMGGCGYSYNPCGVSASPQSQRGFLRGLVNGVASLGNAMLQHPDQVLWMLVGIAMMYGGGTGAAGGGALCLTGVGCLAGAPAMAASISLIVAGAAATGLNGAGLINHAITDNRVEIWKNESAESASGASAAGRAQTGEGWRATSFGDEAASFEYHFSKHGLEAGVTREQYARDALNWAQSPSGVGRPVQLKDGTEGLRYRTPGGGPGGILDRDGNIITFWYR